MKKLLLATLFASLSTPVKPFNWQPIAQAARSCTEWVHSNPGKFVAGATALAALGYIGYRGYTYYMTSPSKDKNTTNFSVTPANTEKGYPIDGTTTSETQNNMSKILMRMFQNFSSNYSPQKISTKELGHVIFEINDPYIIKQIRALQQEPNNLCGIHSAYNTIGILGYLQKDGDAKYISEITRSEDNANNNNILFNEQDFKDALTKNDDMGDLILKARRTNVLQKWLFDVLKKNNQQRSSNESFEQVFERNLGTVAKAIALSCIKAEEMVSSALTKNTVINTLTRQEPICSMIQKNIYDTLLTTLKKNPAAQDEQQRLRDFINQMFASESLEKRFKNEMDNDLKNARESFIEFINELMKKKYSTENNIEELDGDEIKYLFDNLIVAKSAQEYITILDSVDQLELLCLDTESKVSLFKKNLTNQEIPNGFHIFIVGTMNENSSSTGHWFVVVAQKINNKLQYFIMDSLNRDRTKHEIVEKLIKFLNNPISEEAQSRLAPVRPQQNSKDEIEDQSS